MFKIKKTIFFGAVLLTILNNIISGQENMLSNGDFSNGMNNWDFYAGSSVASASVNSGACLIDISFAGSNNYEPQITQDDFAIVAGAEYEARFDAKSVGSARDITFIIGTGPNDYIPFIEETVSLTTDMQTFTYTFTATSSDDNARIDFNCGVTTENVVIDNVFLTKIVPPKQTLVGDTLVLSCDEANGTLQWQESTDSINWNNITGATTNPYKLKITQSPTNKRYFRAKFTDALCPNIPVWYSDVIPTQILNNAQDLQPGDHYYGGIIFYTDGGSGLVAAEQDQGECMWGMEGMEVGGTTDSTGKQNTDTIVASTGDQNWPYAAKICDTLSLNGFTDWFLPAKNQLDLLYQQKDVVGGFSANAYWSSTEDGTDAVWGQEFDENGNQFSLIKMNEYNVRAIRTFDTTTINKIYAHTRVNGQPQTASVILQPQSQNICMNDEVTFSVTATGTSPLTYQWYKNGAVIPDADSSSYTITDAELSDTGYYSCEITNLCRTIMSDSAELSECTQYKTAVVGDTLVLTAENTYGDIQWQQSTDKSTWTDIPEATSPTYKGDVTGSPSGVQYYRIKLHDTTCPDATPWYNNELLRVNILDSISETGSRYLGGIIYHIDENGTGLIAAEHDQGMYNWSWIPDYIGTTDSTGKLNTEKIVAYHTMQSYQQPYAAGICDTLQLNGYNDWFLPAKNELDLLYQKYIFKNPVHEDYWTSTENVEAHEVWVQSFYTGEQNFIGKSNDGVYVQAIKEFQRHNYIYHTISVKGQPQTVSITAQPQSQNICMNDDVTFSVTATGTSPLTYQWYKNDAVIPDADSSSYTIENATLQDTGYYSCEITNLCRTVSSDSAELKVINLSINAGDDKYICSGNNTPLSTADSTNYSDESGDITYSWSPATGLSSTAIANPVADPATSTTYQVTITDEVGCQAFDEVFVFVQNAFADEKICMITIDLETGKNMVVWEKVPGKGTKQYHVYKESNLSDVYNLMGTVPFDSNSVYVDLTSIPEQQQDLYKIAVEDTCGNISAKSLYHKPLFLQFANGQLEWQAYEVEGGSDIGFVSYIIYRGSDSTSLSPIDTVSASKTVYNDTSSVSQSNIFYYRVAGVKSAQCDPNGRLKASGGPYSQSISNLEDNRLKNNNITNLSDFDNSLRISPNPAHTEITILIPNISDESYELCISNTMGKTIFSRSNIQTNKITIPTKDIKSGLYIVKIHGSKVYKGKLIVD